MGIPAGLLNRRVQILKRAPMPKDPAKPRGGYVSAQTDQWGAYRPRATTDETIGGMRFTVATGVLTLRHTSVTDKISSATRVEFDGEVWEILGRQLAEKPDGVVRFDVQQAPSPAMYEREFESRGIAVMVRRIIANAPPVDKWVRAIVTGYRPEEITGGIQVGHRRVIISAADLASSGFPLPLKNTDKILDQGKLMAILAVDDSTHRIAGELLAYEVQAAG